MPYYHGNTRLNLYSASSSRYPTSDSSGKACQAYLPDVPSPKGGVLTLDNNTLSMGSLRAYKDNPNGTFIGDRLTLGSSPYDVYNYGNRGYTTSPFHADGATIYYDVYTNEASVPTVYVLVRAAELSVKDPQGRTYYHYLQVEGTDNGSWEHDLFVADQYGAVTMNGNKTVTITAPAFDYKMGSSSGSADPGWGTSFSFSGSWSTSHVPNKIYLTVSINKEGTKSGYISLTDGSWSDSSGWYSTAWKNTKIKSISVSTTGISFSATKNNTSQPDLTWSATAYYNA